MEKKEDEFIKFTGTKREKNKKTKGFSSIGGDKGRIHDLRRELEKTKERVEESERAIQREIDDIINEEVGLRLVEEERLVGGGEDKNQEWRDGVDKWVKIEEKREKRNNKITEDLRELLKETPEDVNAKIKEIKQIIGERVAKKLELEKRKKIEELKTEQGTKQTTEIDTANLKKMKEFFEGEDGGKFFLNFEQLKKECFDKIEGPDFNKKSEDKKKEIITDIVKSKIGAMFEQGGPLKGKKKMQDRLEKGGYTEIANSFIKEYEIDKVGEARGKLIKISEIDIVEQTNNLNKKIEKKKHPGAWGWIKRMGKSIKSIVGGEKKTEFQIDVSAFGLEIENIYNNPKIDNKDKNKKIEGMIENLKEKSVIGLGLGAKEREETKENVGKLLNEIKKKVDEKGEIKEELAKQKGDNIKGLAKAFGFEVKDEDLDQLLKLSDEINEKAVVKAAEEEARKNGEKDKRKIKEAGEKAVEELKKAKKEGGLGFFGFLKGSGFGLLAILLILMGKKMGEIK